jgi:hypothetical protein
MTIFNFVEAIWVVEVVEVDSRSLLHPHSHTQGPVGMMAG